MELLEQQGYISFLQQTEARLLEACCGKKNARIKREQYRAKTVKRRLLTRFGEIRLTVTYVKGVAGNFFSPLLEWLGIKKYQCMPEELKDVLRDKASKMTFADTAEDILNSFGFQISRQQVWKITQEKQLQITKSNDAHKVLLADGTKIRSNKKGHHEPRAVLSIDLEKKQKSLLSLEVNTTWSEIANSLDLTQYKVLVGDGETGLRQSFTKHGLEFHYCHQHAIRDLSLYLWYDKVQKQNRNEFLNPFTQALYAVQNSTAKYWADKNKTRLLSRIVLSNRQISRLMVQAREKKLDYVAQFLENNRAYFFTAARLAIQQNLKVPWTTNQAERLMKEIGKRTKKRSMRWGKPGLSTILKPILKRYFLEPEKRNHKNIYGGDDIGG